MRLFLVVLGFCLVHSVYSWPGVGSGSDGNPAVASLCAKSPPSSQRWHLVADNTTSLYRIQAVDAPWKCMDVWKRLKTPGAVVNEWNCTTMEDENELVNHTSTGQLQFTSLAPSICLDVSNSSVPWGAEVVLGKCETAVAWTVDSSTSTIRLSSNTSMCLTAALSVHGVPCATHPAAPWCDFSSSAESRASSLIATMSNEEISSQLATNSFTSTDSGQTPGIRRLGIAPTQIHSEGLHGVRLPGDLSHVNATLFPQATALGASFNMSLIRSMGEVMLVEARALYNYQLNNSLLAAKGGGLFYWGPTINIATRSVSWGRGQESVSGDPLLLSSYGTAFVRGFQWGPEGLLPSGKMGVAACPKHFLAYTLEGGTKGDPYTRHNFPALVTPEDIALTYTPVFRAITRLAQPAQIMTSYNAEGFQGGPMYPSSANAGAVTGALRDKWGFSRMVVSDCDAVKDVYASHKFVATAEEATAVSILAGTDVDCGNTYTTSLAGALSSEMLNRSDIVRAATRLYGVRMELGEFDAPEDQPLASLTLDILNSPEHHSLALEAARQSVVILQRDPSVLPLRTTPPPSLPFPSSQGTNVSKIALIGPFATDTLVWMGSKHDYAAGRIVSAEAGLTARAPHCTINVQQGCGVNSAGSKSQEDAAVAAARESDVVVFVGGIDGTIEHEGSDREFITMPTPQQALLQKIKAASKGPVILVVANGGPVALDWEASNIPTIIEALEPGEGAGTAIAELLFGDLNPSAALPYDIPAANYTNTHEITNMSMRDGGGRTYRYRKSSTALWPFGFSSSFSPFTFSTTTTTTTTSSSLTASASSIAEAVKGNGDSGKRGMLELDVQVHNAGSMTAARPVLTFVSRDRSKDPSNIVGPVRTLVDFTKLSLTACSTTKLTTNLLFPNVLGWNDRVPPAPAPSDSPTWCGICEFDTQNNATVIVPGTYSVWVGGDAGDVQPSNVFQTTLTITGSSPSIVTQGMW